jgi:hypothetical protein
MATPLNVTTQFQIWIDRLTAKTNTLVSISDRGNLRELERELNTSLAMFKHLANYAIENNINLSEYRDHTMLIANNFEQVEQAIKRRQRPLSKRIIDFLWTVAEPIDGFLNKMGVPPVVFPLMILGQELSDYITSRLPRLTPPDIPLQLPPVTSTITSPQVMPTDSGAGKPQQPLQHPFLPDFLDCIGDCYPKVAKQIDTTGLKTLASSDPNSASNLLQNRLWSALQSSNFRSGNKLEEK